jgi:ABC-type sulfate transport system permease component
MNAVSPTVATGQGYPRRYPSRFPSHPGFTIFYLSAIVLIPLAALVAKTVTPTADYPGVFQVVGHVVKVATDVRALDSYRLSLGFPLWPR